MSSANYLLTEEQLWCCICLDVFTDPVTLPCGHNFCKNCIMHHLNSNPQRQCPMCKERVDKKYKLGVNTFISEMAVQFRQSTGKKATNTPQQHAVIPGRVSNNAPTEPKRTSLKSCLLFTLSLTSLICFLQLYFHQTVSGWKTDQQFDSVEKGAESMCPEHNKPLELYCKNEQIPICQSCMASSHRLHQVIPLKDAYEEKRTELEQREDKIQQMTWQRQLKIQELKHAVKLSEEAAHTEIAVGTQVFTSLTQSLERAQVELVSMIEEKQRKTKKKTLSFIVGLEQEISKLMKWRAEVEQLSRSKDHLHFLHSYSSLSAAPSTKDWTEVRICPAVYEGLTKTAMVTAVTELTEAIRNGMKKLQDAELKNILQFAVEVTLDPDTAHPALILSDDGKQVHCGDESINQSIFIYIAHFIPPATLCALNVWKKLAFDLKRFDTAINVLGKQSFSCGRFHFDVQVKEKTGWTLGVARESVNRKGEIKLNPENGYWAIRFQDRRQYSALDSNPIRLSVNYLPQKVRVFVDYEDGLVSFYNVDAAVLLYSFTGCSFTEKLYPFFSPGTNDNGRNSAPLVISSFSTD